MPTWVWMCIIYKGNVWELVHDFWKWRRDRRIYIRFLCRQHCHEPEGSGVGRKVLQEVFRAGPGSATKWMSWIDKQAGYRTIAPLLLQHQSERNYLGSQNSLFLDYLAMPQKNQHLQYSPVFIKRFRSKYRGFQKISRCFSFQYFWC